MNPIEKYKDEALELLVKHVPEVKDQIELVRIILNILVKEVQFAECMKHNKVIDDLERSFK